MEYDADYVKDMIERLKLASAEIKAKKVAEEAQFAAEEQAVQIAAQSHKEIVESVKLVFGQKPPKRAAKAKVEKPKQESMF